ncbi:hypothetical protein I656_00158 [Geobacillus sp. WSUCF1]|nr:hypothetical protein I656_00158 [Geobacillus sp. WSUCF1]
MMGVGRSTSLVLGDLPFFQRRMRLFIALERP